MRLPHRADVVGFLRDDMPHPTTRGWHIAVVPGNHMDVHVKDRLPRDVADVYAEIVAIGLMDPLDGGPGVGNRGHQLRALLVGGLEP